jgi:hypothetical protein
MPRLSHLKLNEMSLTPFHKCPLLHAFERVWISVSTWRVNFTLNLSKVWTESLAEITRFLSVYKRFRCSFYLSLQASFSRGLILSVLPLGAFFTKFIKWTHNREILPVCIFHLRAYATDSILFLAVYCKRCWINLIFVSLGPVLFLLYMKLTLNFLKFLKNGSSYKTLALVINTDVCRLCSFVWHRFGFSRYLTRYNEK